MVKSICMFDWVCNAHKEVNWNIPSGISEVVGLGTRCHKYARVGVKLASWGKSYFDLNFKSLGATNFCLCYAPGKVWQF